MEMSNNNIINGNIDCVAVHPTIGNAPSAREIRIPAPCQVRALYKTLRPSHRTSVPFELR